MIISKNSWHYKLNKGMSHKVYTDTFTTCSYIRHTIWNMLCALLCVVVLAIIFGTLGAVGVAIGVFLVNGFIALPVTPFVTFMIEPGMIFFSLVSIWAVCAISGDMIMEWAKTPRKKEQEQQKDSLLLKALQDRKDGICTLVEFK